MASNLTIVLGSHVLAGPNISQVIIGEVIHTNRGLWEQWW